MKEGKIEISEVTLKLLGFKSKMPQDIYHVLSVETNRRGKFLLNLSPDMKANYQNMSDCIAIENRCWHINHLKSEIYFTGDYSKIKVVYWFQKLKETLFPEKVKLKYIAF